MLLFLFFFQLSRPVAIYSSTSLTTEVNAYFASHHIQTKCTTYATDAPADALPERWEAQVWSEGGREGGTLHYWGRGAQ